MNVANLMLIPSRSNHKNEAVLVLKEFLSKEIQTMIAVKPNTSLVPVITDLDVLNQFGSDVSYYKGKNLMAFFKREPAGSQRSQWDQYRETDSYFTKFFELDMDIPLYLDYLKKTSGEKIEQAKISNK